MRTSTLLAIAASVLATTISATPTPPYPIHLRSRAVIPEECPCAEDVAYVAQGFGDLIANYNRTLASDILSADFEDYSDSISFLMGLAPTTPQTATFSSLADFELGSASQPPVPFTILELFHSCRKAVIRWVATPGSQVARGMTVMHLVQGNGSANGWQIHKQFAEFNVAAWANDVLAGSCVSPPPPAGASPPSASTTASTTAPAVALH